MNEKIGRREFFKKSARIGVSAALGGTFISHLMNNSSYAFTGESVDIAVVTSSDYFKSTEEAIKLIGEIKKFVPKNSSVGLLPNVQSRHPGTYTKLEIVRAVIKLCKEAGAKEINCLSLLPKKNWEAVGLDKVIEEEGANLVLVDRNDESLFRTVTIANGKALKEARIMKEFYSNDIFIDMPITKDHAGNKFTGTMKNLMGLNSRKCNRSFHKEGWKTEINAIEHLDQCIADLNTVIQPNLCVVDATELITTNGPMGPGELIKPQKVIAGMDRVAIDAYCTTLWGMEPKDIIMINSGYKHKLGEIDLAKVKIKEKKI